MIFPHLISSVSVFLSQQSIPLNVFFDLRSRSASIPSTHMPYSTYSPVWFWSVSPSSSCIVSAMYRILSRIIDCCSSAEAHQCFLQSEIQKQIELRLIKFKEKIITLLAEVPVDHLSFLPHYYRVHIAAADKFTVEQKVHFFFKILKSLKLCMENTLNTCPLQYPCGKCDIK